MESLLAWIGQNPVLAGAVIFAIAFCDALIIVGAIVPALPLLFAVGMLIGLGEISGPYAVACATLGAFLGDATNQSAAASQIGKPYDYTAILGLGLRRDWQEEDAWFCSELVAWAFQHAGEPLFRAECLRRVTPQHLWMLAPAPPPPDPALLAPIEGRLVRPSSF